jgi:hypothetical protein
LSKLKSAAQLWIKDLSFISKFFFYLRSKIAIDLFDFVQLSACKFHGEIHCSIDRPDQHSLELLNRFSKVNTSCGPARQIFSSLWDDERWGGGGGSIASVKDPGSGDFLTATYFQINKPFINGFNINVQKINSSLHQQKSKIEV